MKPERIQIGPDLLGRWTAIAPKSRLEETFHFASLASAAAFAAQLATLVDTERHVVDLRIAGNALEVALASATSADPSHAELELGGAIEAAYAALEPHHKPEPATRESAP